MRLSPGQRGLTLIEVLVALVMTGMVVGVAFHLFTGAIRGHARADRLTMALLIAESRMAEVGATVKLQPGTQTGRTADGFRWTVAIRPFSSPAPPPAIPFAPTPPVVDTTPVRAFSVKVSVADARGGGPVTLETLRLRPRRRDE